MSFPNVENSATDADDLPIVVNNNASFTSFSPVRCLADLKPCAKKASSVDFAEQIKRLETEGQRLRIAGRLANLDQSFPTPNRSTGSPAKDSEGLLSSPVAVTPVVSTATMAALMDVHAEQKTIEYLRNQLEKQQKEAERLQRQLSGDAAPPPSLPLSSALSLASSSHSAVFGGPPRPQAASSTTPQSAPLPSSTLTSLAALKQTLDRNPPSHLEKALKDSQEQVTTLRKRLFESSELADQQKQQFRSTIEDLRTKLQDAVVSRDRVLEMREKEASSQGEIITKLQSQALQLEEMVRRQQAELEEGNKKVENLNHHGYLCDSALSQIRLLLSDMERKQGRAFNEREPLSKQNGATLVTSIEKCLHGFRLELESTQTELYKVRSEADQKTAQHTQLLQALNREHQDRISMLVAEHGRQLESALERAGNAREQSASLQAQLTLLQQQYDEQLSLRDDTIRAQESQGEQSSAQHVSDRESWANRNKELEERLCEVHAELASLKAEKEEALNEHTETDTTLQLFKVRVFGLETEVASMKEAYSSQEKDQAKLKEEKVRLERRLDDQQREVTQLEKLLGLAKQEAELQLQSQAANLERSCQEKASEQISLLTSQLSAASQRADTAELQLSEAKTEITNLKLQLSKLNERLQLTVSELEANTEAGGHAARQLEEQISQGAHRAEERDYYRHLVEEKNTELREVRAERDKLRAQLEENDNNLKTIYQQSTNLSQIVEINTKTTETMREEKERLSQELTEKNSAIVELKAASDNIAKKLESRQKRLKECEEDRKKLMTQLDERKQEVLRSTEDKEKTVREFEKYKYHISLNNQESEKTINSLRAQKLSLEKQVKKLAAKLKASEGELQLARSTIHSKDSVDGKAVKVADRLQTEVTAKRGEVDKLKSLVHWLEERVETVSKEKKSAEASCEQLYDKVDKLTSRNTSLSRELSNHRRKHEDLKHQTSLLQSGLEKAAVKNSSAQRQAEELEQEIARLKLSHQLQIKEAHVQLTNQGSRSAGHTPVKDSAQAPARQDSASTTSAQQKDELISLGVFKEIGEQLKCLLTQVKTLLSSQAMQTAADFPVNSEPQSPEMKTVCQWEREAARIQSVRNHAHNHQHAAELSEQSKSESDISFSSECQSTKLTNQCSQFLSESGISAPSFDKTNIDSPETSGLNNDSTPSYGADCTRPYSAAKDKNSYIPGGKRPIAVRSATDTFDLCRSLEARMETLSKMGGNLQRENQEMANLMEVQGKKIQKVKNSERRVHKKR